MTEVSHVADRIALPFGAPQTVLATAKPHSWVAQVVDRNRLPLPGAQVTLRLLAGS